MNRVCYLQSDDPRHRPGLRTCPEILRRDLFDRLAPQRFHPEIERTCVPRAFSLVRNALHELCKKRVLHMDRKGQHPIEEPLDGWQLFQEHAVPVDQPQCRPIGESLIAHRLRSPRGKIGVVPAQRGPRDGTFEIVFFAEHALRAGFALAFGERAKLIETFADCRCEAFFTVHVRSADPEERRVDLSRAMRAPKPLDGRIRTPAGLQQVMATPLLVFRCLRRMIGSPRATCIREDQDVLFPIHKRLRLG